MFYTPGMLSPDGPSLLSLLALLVPVALAARGRSRPGRKKSSPQPKVHPFRGLLFVVGGVALVGVGALLLVRLTSPPRAGVSSSPPGASPFPLDGALGEAWTASVARVCPRFAALQRGDSGQPRRFVVELTMVECLDRLCEHPEKLDAELRAASGRLKPVCERMRSLFDGEIATMAEGFREACPEVFQTWSGHTWSTSNHLGLYADVRQCMERRCAEADGGDGAEKDCQLAADIAEGLGDAQAAARSRERARLARARADAEWEALSPEEREARLDKDEHDMARGLLAACRQGKQRFCRALAKYCELESHPPPGVCPAPGRAAAIGDAGSR
jgi:hypothetical protein